MTLTADDPRHGTVNGYINCRCRCGACKTVHSAYHRAYMANHPEQQEKHRASNRAWWRNNRKKTPCPS